MLYTLLKGRLGEKFTQFGMWMNLDERVYRRCADVIVPSQSGTTQIDDIVVSRYGVFVIEVKNYAGDIYGAEHDAQWVVSSYGREFPFQNPLRQNYRHTQCLSEFLHLDPGVFHSVVYFVGDCRFKTPMPMNVIRRGLSDYIRSFKDVELDESDVAGIFAALTRLKNDPRLTMSAHLASLAQHHASRPCPWCGSPMVERTAHTGPNAGSQFFGCSSFPKCRGTMPLDRDVSVGAVE